MEHPGVDGADQPGGAVGDDQQRRPQPPAGQLIQEVTPGVGRFGSAGGQGYEYGLAFGVDAPCGQDGLGAGAGVHLEHGGVQEQVVQHHAVQRPGPPRLELPADRLADPRDRRLRQGRLGAQGISEGVLHVPDRQATDEPGDHQRFQRIAPGHRRAEQPGRERLGRAPQLRPRHGHRPGGGLDRRRAIAITRASPGVLRGGRALVAGPAQERLDLGFQRGLDDQPGAEAGDILDHLAQLTLPAEQGIDLGTDLLGRR